MLGEFLRKLFTGFRSKPSPISLPQTDFLSPATAEQVAYQRYLTSLIKFQAITVRAALTELRLVTLKRQAALLIKNGNTKELAEAQAMSDILEHMRGMDWDRLCSPDADTSLPNDDAEWMGELLQTALDNQIVGHLHRAAASTDAEEIDEERFMATQIEEMLTINWAARLSPVLPKS
jgi:hypothetical protein